MHRHLGTTPRSAAVRSALAVCVLLLAAGCADSDPDDPPASAQEPARGSDTPIPTSTPTSTQTTTQTPTPTPTPTSTPSDDQTTPPTDGLQKVRVVGVVERTGDCVVVRDDNGITWTVMGDPVEDLPTGERVAVTGAPDLAATGCGGPLVRATRVSPAG